MSTERAESQTCATRALISLLRRESQDERFDRCEGFCEARLDHQHMGLIAMHASGRYVWHIFDDDGTELLYGGSSSLEHARHQVARELLLMAGKARQQPQRA